MKLPAVATAVLFLTGLVLLVALPPSSSAEQVASDAPAYLAVVEETVPGEDGPQVAVRRLVAIAEDGSMRTVLTRDVGSGGGFQLADWSEDGRTALIVEPRRKQAVLVDVATGETEVRPLGRRSLSAAKIMGKQLLQQTSFDRLDRSKLVVIDKEGNRTRIAYSTGPVVLTAAGLLVTTGAGTQDRSLRVMRPNGRLVRRVATPFGHCPPLRQWKDERVLVRCAGPQRQWLALFDPANGELDRLTPKLSWDGPWMQPVDARRLSNSLYVEFADACGSSLYQAKGARVVQVPLPGAPDSVRLVGSSGGRLIVEHTPGCNGPAALSRISKFDPETGDEDVLAELPRGQYFGTVLMAGERDDLFI